MSKLPPAIRWSYLISESAAWFESFALHLGGPDITIIPDYEDDKPPVFFWSSRHFSDLTNLEELKDRTAALKALFDGAMHVYMPGIYHSLKLGGLYDHKEKRSCGYLSAGDPLAPTFSSTAFTWRYESFGGPMEHPVSRWIFLSRYSDVAKHLLQFLGVNGITWVSLYAALDFLRSKKVNVARLAQVSQAEINRFTHTANNFSAIGPFARHGELGRAPPRNPMNIDEASKLILAAVRGYLEYLVAESELFDFWKRKLLYLRE